MQFKYPSSSITVLDTKMTFQNSMNRKTTDTKYDFYLNKKKIIYCYE